MASAGRPITAEEFFRMPEPADGSKQELVGEVDPEDRRVTV
jgi:hypothetical protein